MYQGVVTAQISLRRWVELAPPSTSALMFGLQGKKGVIQPGRRRRSGDL